MANVYTKRSKMPRTTTLSDYGFRSRVSEVPTEQSEETDYIRLHSPTRRQNPQPIGLVYQSPYNRHNHVFGIWNPNQMMPVLRCSKTLPHLRATNFSCRHDTEVLAKYMTPISKEAPSARSQPEVHYTTNTIQRQCFKWPQQVPSKFRGMVKTTRFGHSPHRNGAVMGIGRLRITPDNKTEKVPNVITSRVSDKQDGTRGPANQDSKCERLPAISNKCDADFASKT